jgi:hypothetical protein
MLYCDTEANIFRLLTPRSQDSQVRIDTAFVGVVDGISRAFWRCKPASLNCFREPTQITAGALLTEGTVRDFLLSQIRNLARGFNTHTHNTHTHT